MSDLKKPEILAGVVTSAKATKTITVTVSRDVRHPKYSKVQRKKSVFYVHDEQGEAKDGDLVEIAATRPLSKTKHWRLVKIVKRADVV